MSSQFSRCLKSRLKLGSREGQLTGRALEVSGSTENEFCEDYVSLRTFKMHKVQFYNPETKQWSKKRKISGYKSKSKRGSQLNEDDFEDDMIIIGTLYTTIYIYGGSLIVVKVIGYVIMYALITWYKNV